MEVERAGEETTPSAQPSARGHLRNLERSSPSPAAKTVQSSPRPSSTKKPARPKKARGESAGPPSPPLSPARESALTEEKALLFRESFAPHPLIPPQRLGDLLEIYSFFHHFEEVLDAPLFQLEELHVALEYAGEAHLDFLHDLHAVVLGKFAEGYEGPAQEQEAGGEARPVWFPLLAKAGLRERQRELLMRLAWPQLLAEQLSLRRTTGDDRVLQLLKELDVRRYNQLDPADKVRILLRLVNCCAQLPDLKALHQKLHERVLRLTKEKVELTDRAKQLRKAEKELQEQLRESRESEEMVREGQPPEQILDIERLTEFQLLQKHSQKLQRASEKNVQRIAECEQGVATVKRDLLLCVHTADCLGRDHDLHALFVFAFDSERLFRCSPDNAFWTVSQQPIADYLPLLSSRDRTLSALRSRITVYAASEPLGRRRPPRSAESHLGEVLGYRSLYDRRNSARKTAESDPRQAEVAQLLAARRLPELLELDFAKQLATSAETKMRTFLASQRMEWAGVEDGTASFAQTMAEIDDAAQFCSFMAGFEQRFLTAQQLVTDDEQSREESEASEVDFRRHRLRRDAPPTKRYARKTINLKFWNHAFNPLKLLFREFAARSPAPATAFLLALLILISVTRFIATRVEKEQKRVQVQQEQLQREQRQQREQREKREQDEEREQREQQVEEKEAAQAPRRRGRPPLGTCSECADLLRGNRCRCAGCEQEFHPGCVGFALKDPPSNWKCDTCTQTLNDLRAGRNARKRLRVEE